MADGEVVTREAAWMPCLMLGSLLVTCLCCAVRCHARINLSTCCAALALIHPQGIGLTVVNGLDGELRTSYKGLSTTSSTYKFKVKRRRNPEKVTVGDQMQMARVLTVLRG